VCLQGSWRLIRCPAWPSEAWMTAAAASDSGKCSIQPSIRVDEFGDGGHRPELEKKSSIPLLGARIFRNMEGFWRGPLGEAYGAVARPGLLQIDGDGHDVLAAALRACSRTTESAAVFPAIGCTNWTAVKRNGIGMEVG
jgi:hypothetical protein